MDGFDKANLDFVAQLPSGERSNWEKLCKIYICNLLIHMISSSLGSIAFCLTYKTRVSILSLFWREGDVSWIYLFFVLIQFGIFISSWMGTISMASLLTMYNISADSVAERLNLFLKTSKSLIDKADNFHSFMPLLFTYKQFKLCNILYNEVLRPYFFVVISCMLTGLSVVSFTLAVGFHKHLDNFTLLTAYIILIAATLEQIFTYLVCGNVNDATVKFTKTLMRKAAMSEMTKENKVLLCSYARSLQPVRIEYSSFGYYKKQNTFRVIPRVLYYSAKGILTIKQII